MTRQPFVYILVSARVIDGDTIEAVVDQGLDVLHRVRLRLVGVNCPEARDPGGPEATAATRAWVEVRLSRKARITVATLLRQKEARTFERWVASVEDDQGQRLEDYLLASGHAQPMKP